MESQLRPAVVVSATIVVPASTEALTLRATAAACVDSSVPARRCSTTRLSQPKPRLRPRHPARPSPASVLKLEVRVRVDEARHDRRVAEIQVAPPLRRLAHPGDSSPLDRQAAVPDWRSFHRINVTCLNS